MDAPTTRIAVTSEDLRGLDAQVGQHFGRCPAYTLVEVAGDGTLRANAIENPHAAGHGPGQVPAFIHDQGADVLLTGGIGGRAIAALRTYGIQVSAGHDASVREAVEAWLAGRGGKAEACAGHGPSHDHEHGHDCGRGA